MDLAKIYKTGYYLEKSPVPDAGMLRGSGFMPDAFPISEFYSVYFRPYDAGGDGGSLLDSARREYFARGGTVRGNVRTVENGREVRTRYRIGAGGFRWKKTCGGKTMQEAFSLPGGRYRLVSHGPDGRLLSAAAYDSGLHWIQTAYYDGDPAKPAAVLRRSGEGICCLEYVPESGGYRKTRLLSCPWEPGTAAQSYINGKAGEPRVVARTDAGGFCFCPEKEQKFRQALRKRLNEDPTALTPEWPGETEKTPLDFHVIPNDGAAPVAPVPAKPVPLARPFPTKEPARVSPPKPGHERRDSSGFSGASGADYAADHEIFTVDASPSGRGPKYAVAAKGLSGGVVRAADLKKRKPESAAPPDGKLIPAKRIVVSSMESYLYFGKLLDGLRQGPGRTQMENGHTAYEGGYLDDKREGFGVYYYKSGKICYAGGWKRNLRNGLGVAFGSRDGSIFVGHWKDGAATGMGSEFDMVGNLVYTGGWKDGRRDGLGTEYRSGRVFRTGKWCEDRFCPGYGRLGPEPGDALQ